VIVAPATPLFALVTAISIRELDARLILGFVLLPLLVLGDSMDITAALLFKQIGIAPSLGTIVVVQIPWASPYALVTAMSTFDPVLTEAAP
jgi:ABC-type spermidine/putrescine transport system permease subunit II